VMRRASTACLPIQLSLYSIQIDANTKAAKRYL
jgi:hypothetical protein